MHVVEPFMIVLHRSELGSAEGIRFCAKASGLEFRVWGLGFRVWGLGFRGVILGFYWNLYLDNGK